MNQTQKFIGLLAILPLALVTLNPNLVGYADADMADDAIAKLETAKDELVKDPPDNQAAAGNIEGAIGDIQAAVDSGELGESEGNDLMDQLAGVAKQLASEAIDKAIDAGGDSEKISDAEQLRIDGDALRASGAYKDAASKYKDAVAKAESV